MDCRPFSYSCLRPLQKCSFLHITDFWHYLLHIFLSPHLHIFCNQISLNSFFTTFSFFFTQKCLPLSFPVSLDQRHWDLQFWWHSVCPSVPVQKCGQNGLHSASWRPSVHYEEVYIFINQIKTLKFRLRGIHERQCKDFPELMRKQDYGYWLRMLNCFPSPDVNLVDTTADCLLITEYGLRVVEDTFNLIFLDGRHWEAAIDILPMASRAPPLLCH